MAEKIKALSLFGRTPYRNLFPQIPTLNETDYFLQFNAYEIFLPQRAKAQDTLNIFERSVLKFKALGNFSPEELADKLCLEKDFIKFIMIRLTELGFLDKSQQITDAGRNFLGQELDAPIENIVPYILLVTRDTGEIFPTFFTREDQVDAVLEKPFVKLFFGSTGQSTTLDGRCVFVKEQIRRPQTLLQKKIHDALHKFNHHVDNKIIVKAADNIQSTYTQPIFLHVKAVLQDGNVDYAVVSDGQNSHSEFLRTCLEAQKPDLLMRLKESATKIFERRKENSAPDAGKYFEIRKAMLWESFKITSVDEIELAAEKQRRQLENLSKAVEWALFYHLLKFPPPQQLIRTLSLQTPEENFKTLTGFAAQLGLTDASKFPSFFSGISGGSVKNCMTPKDPALVPLLAVNIATAVRVADSNLLDALNALPEDDAFGFLQRLDAYGKKLRHENKWSPKKDDTPAFLREYVLKFIQALLPDYDNPAAVAADLSNTSQRKLNAQLAVMRLLGEQLFQNLSADVQALMLKISPDKIGGQVLAPLEFITTLSIILEKLFLLKLKNSCGKISASKSEVIARLAQSGKSLGLKTVSDNFYSQACKGEKATLGAYLLAYLSTLDDQQFNKFTAANFHETIFEIATLRGHANNLALVIDAKKLSDLRDEIFKLIKFWEADKIDTGKD